MNAVICATLFFSYNLNAMKGVQQFCGAVPRKTLIERKGSGKGSIGWGGGFINIQRTFHGNFRPLNETSQEMAQAIILLLPITSTTVPHLTGVGRGHQQHSIKQHFLFLLG